jgi:hypothetical protein
MEKETDPLDDLTRIMTQFKVLDVDLAPIIESRRKGMDALVASKKGRI